MKLIALATLLATLSLPALAWEKSSGACMVKVEINKEPMYFNVLYIRQIQVVKKDVLIKLDMNEFTSDVRYYTVSESSVLAAARMASELAEKINRCNK